MSLPPVIILPVLIQPAWTVLDKGIERPSLNRIRDVIKEHRDFPTRAAKSAHFQLHAHYVTKRKPLIYTKTRNLRSWALIKRNKIIYPTVILFLPNPDGTTTTVIHDVKANPVSSFKRTEGGLYLIRYPQWSHGSVAGPNNTGQDSKWSFGSILFGLSYRTKYNIMKIETKN